MVRIFKKIIALCAWWTIRLFKVFFQIPDGCCRFYPTCSCYAKEALEKLPLSEALVKITLRLLSCQPFSIKGKKAFFPNEKKQHV